VPRFRRNVAFHIKHDRGAEWKSREGGIAGCTGSCAVTILYVVKRLASSPPCLRKRDFNILSFDTFKTRRVQTRDIYTYDPIPWIKRLKRTGGNWLDIATCQSLMCGLPRRMFQNVELPLGGCSTMLRWQMVDAKKMMKNYTTIRKFKTKDLYVIMFSKINIA